MHSDLLKRTLKNIYKVFTFRWRMTKLFQSNKLKDMHDEAAVQLSYQYLYVHIFVKKVVAVPSFMHVYESILHDNNLM